MDIDYALICNFVDLDGPPRQLRFRRDDDPRTAADVLCGTGQLVAVITEGTVNLVEIHRRVQAAAGLDEAL
jgi:hypothetical protein